jgi:hypothetical protein
MANKLTTDELRGLLDSLAFDESTDEFIQSTKRVLEWACAEGMGKGWSPEEAGSYERFEALNRLADVAEVLLEILPESAEAQANG